MPVVDRNQCSQNLRDTHLGHFFHLGNNMLCAGGEEDADACRVRYKTSDQSGDTKLPYHLIEMMMIWQLHGSYRPFS